MPVREPSWWYRGDGGWPAKLLAPAARLWGWAAVRRIKRAAPAGAGLPVICIGNFTAGGTGKTPLSIHIAEILAGLGERPVFLTRGYGGRLSGPHRVVPAFDRAHDVGDEPLLLARHAPVIVARDRVAGAALAAGDAGNSPPTVIVMDDGMQNPSLVKDLSIAVVDGLRGLGNGHVIPAGPLRAPLETQLGLADAILVNRPPGVAVPGTLDLADTLRGRFTGPVLEATVEAGGAVRDLSGARVVALAGIANPGRFYALLEGLGAEIVGRAEFADHHAFSAHDAETVLNQAVRLGARIMTTEKDWVRLAAATGPLARLKEQAEAVPIRLVLAPADAMRLKSLIEAALLWHAKKAVKP